MTALAPRARATTEAYRAGAMALLLTLAVILGALAFEHIGGYAPCELCLTQRYAYYAGVPLLFLALIATSAEWRGLATALFLFVALAFLINAGIGVYQSGAEWKLWPGPTACSGGDGITTKAGSLLEAAANTHVIRCDEPALRIFGLSLAGWNVIASATILWLAARAAHASNRD
jgi:disulfide bond formation protein DsbB